MTPERFLAVPTLPARPQDSNKGMYGRVLVVAGSRGMIGAAALCGGACLRSGAGLVRIACPSVIAPTVASFEPSYMTLALPHDDDGLVQFEPSRGLLEKALEKTDVLAVGPGLGESDEVKALIHWLLDAVKVPIVLDADGLNALDGDAGRLHGRSAPTVITPHPGEFARLVGASIKEVQADREGRAVALAGTSGALVVLLKGSRTVVTDGRRVYVNETGNPGMATGGVGDVLTGVIAALLGQKLPAFEAAVLGAYAHGLAGDIARDQNGMIGMVAGDVVDALPDAFQHLAG